MEQLGNATTDNLMHFQSDIFKGVNVFLNGVTKPPIVALKMMILNNGGRISKCMNKNVTHVVASNLTATAKKINVKNTIY